MTRGSRRLPVRGLIAVLILGIGSCVWQARRQELADKRDALAEAEARLQSATARWESARSALEQTREELSAQRESRLTTLVQVKRIEEQLARPVPDDPWTELPPGGAGWIPESPYVWLSKATLAQLSSNPFRESGELRKEFAEALAITEEQRQKVSAELRGVVTEYQALQVAHAETSVSPPAREGESAKITVRIPALPEASERLKAQVAAALESELGVQRKELLTKLGRRFLESKLNSFGSREEKIAAKRRKDGAYEIWRGDGMMGGPRRLDDHIPSHLMPFFAELQAIDLGAN